MASRETGFHTALPSNKGELRIDTTRPRGKTFSDRGRARPKDLGKKGISRAKATKKEKKRGRVLTIVGTVAGVGR